MIDELASSPAVILAGDFNSNAEYGPERTGSVQKILAAGFSDAWLATQAGDPGYSWPMFVDDPVVRYGDQRANRPGVE